MSVNAELFHRDHDPLVHYGPVWSKRRESGESFAACDSANEHSSATLTTHAPWVTCRQCREFLFETSADTGESR